MMQNVPPLTDVPPTQDIEELVTESVAVEAPERMAAMWVGRITGVVGGIFLLIALIVWAARPGHYRLVLLLLVVAMFAAILHSYTFDDGT